MKHIRGIRQWIENDGMPAAYRSLSYVLFRTDSEHMEILASRCPDPRIFPVGRSFAAAMELSEEAMEYLKGDGREQALYFLESKVGVGLLHKGFDRRAGMGIYLHIHGSPVSLSRLLRGGLLAGQGLEDIRVSSDMEDRGHIRKWDEAACGALLDAWSEIRGRGAEGGVWTARGDGFLSVYDLERGLEELAAFAGCKVNLSRDRAYPGGIEGISAVPTRVRCYSPRLLEALSLFLLTVAGTLSTDRQVNCRLATRGEGCHLLLSLEWLPEL